MTEHRKPALVIHPILREQHPQFVNALLAPAGNYNPNVIYVHPDLYTDQTPHLKLPFNRAGVSLALIPGFVSGHHAESQLDGLIKTAHALRFKNPGDPRSPRAKGAMMLFSDLEGRGTKSTMNPSGEYIDDAELHYAYYIADLLRGVGRIDKLAVMDPHDLVSVQAIHKPYITLTALQQIATTLRSKGMIPVNAGVIIADDGAIGRSHFFAKAAGIPVVGRIEKARRGGVARVERIHSIDPNGFKNQLIFLVDDMIATGGTLCKDALALKKMGAKSVTGVITHVKGVPHTDVKIRDELHAHKSLDRLVITNTTPYYRQLMGIPGVKLVDILPIWGKAAQAFLSPNFSLTDGSVSGIEAIKEHVFHMDTIDGYKRRLSLQYPELVPEL